MWCSFLLMDSDEDKSISDKRWQFKTTNERHYEGIILRGWLRGRAIPLTWAIPLIVMSLVSEASLLAVMMVNQRVTDWRFWGIKKLHELPEVLESQLKSSQKNILKITSHTLISSTTIKDSFKPEYYSVVSVKVSRRIGGRKKSHAFRIQINAREMHENLLNDFVTCELVTDWLLNVWVVSWSWPTHIDWHRKVFGVAFGFNGYICDIEIIMESVVDIIAAKALYEIRKKKEWCFVVWWDL